MQHEEFIQSKTQVTRGETVAFLDREGEIEQKQENVIFLSPFGSHLYGTSTPKSDLDVKAVYMSSLEDIILKEDQETIRFSTGDNSNITTEGDLDVELIELRKFLSDAMQGQTYAVELLHCPESLRLIETTFSDKLFEKRDRLLSSKVKPFVGYCKTQARKYSMKGARLNELEKVRNILQTKEGSTRLESVCLSIPIDSMEYVDYVNQEVHNQEDPITLLKVGGKKYNLHSKVSKVLDSLEKEIEKYGDRAHRAKDGIDWKAIHHAYRVAFELRELLSEGKIKFPLRKAEFLKEVKKGNISYERADEEIPLLVEEVTNMEGDIDSEPDREFWREWVKRVYQFGF